MKDIMKDINEKFKNGLQKVVELREKYHKSQQELAACARLIQERDAELQLARAHVGEGGFSIADVRVLSSTDAWPHRHLELVLLGVSLPGRRFAKLRLRLVDHYGKAGLAFFHTGAANIAPPLLRWQESGQEGANSYMLLVPADASAKRYLTESLGTDFHFIHRVAEALECFLRKGAHTADATTGPAIPWLHWLGVACRLRENLAELPRRLHYDDVLASDSVSRDRQVQLAFEVRHACSIDRFMHSLRLEWLLSCGGGLLHLHLPDLETPPLRAWPLDDHGNPQPKLSMRFDIPCLLPGRGKRFAKKNPWFANATRGDREFVADLLREMNNFLYHWAKKNPTKKPTERRARRAAKRLRAFAKSIIG